MIFRAIALTAIIPGPITTAAAQTSPTDSHAATAAESQKIDPRPVTLVDNGDGTVGREGP